MDAGVDPFADEWFHMPFRTHASKPVPDKYRHTSLPGFLYGADGIWLKRYKWHTARRRHDKPGPSKFPAWQLWRAIRRHAARAALLPSTCPPSEHQWNNEGNDPTHCVRCGMSFTRHIFTECP